MLEKYTRVNYIREQMLSITRYKTQQVIQKNREEVEK